MRKIFIVGALLAALAGCSSYHGPQPAIAQGSHVAHVDPSLIQFMVGIASKFPALTNAR